jgi:hypothetical protein
MVELGILNGSEPQPSAGAAAPMTDELDVAQGVSVRPTPPELAGVAPAVTDAEETVVPGAALTWGLTWACATFRAPSHRIVTQMNIRSIALSKLPKR